MPFSIVVKDISEMKVDAVVNTTNSDMICAGRGVDFSIHAAAGPKLQAECIDLAPCDECDVRITRAYKLPAKIVIHTVAPYYNGTSESIDRLNMCFVNVLQAAVDHKCKSIAIPLIGAGNNGFPLDTVLFSATEISKRFLEDNDLSIYLNVFSRKNFNPTISFLPPDYERKKAPNRPSYYAEVSPLYILLHKKNSLDSYDDSSYDIPDNPIFHTDYEAETSPSFKESIDEQAPFAPCMSSIDSVECKADYAAFAADFSLDEIDEDDLEVDESFGQLVTRLAEKYYPKTSQFYVAANITKSIYSKMKTVPSYVPSRSTALACAVVLKSKGVDETELLRHAGMVLTPSDKRDKIILAAFRHNIYNVFTINEALFKYDLPLLGYRA